MELNMALALGKRKLMNKKTAFFATAKLLQKMGVIKANSAISVLLVRSDLLGGNAKKNASFGKNIFKGNKPINNFQRSTTVLSKPFNEK
jgi:hypothetical protein